MKFAFLFSLTLAAAVSSVALANDTVTTVPVHFTKGASHAVMQGTFSGYDSVRYTLTAKAGQHMTVHVEGSRSANFNVFAPGSQPGASAALGSGYVGGDWSAELPVSGQYTVDVYQMRATARRGTKVSYSIDLQVR
ncbi:MAG: hypothetical protein AAAB13_14415 [Pseudomonas sp.]